MSDHNEHAAHEHGVHAAHGAAAHAGHGPVAHVAPGDWHDAYARALAAAQPAEGRAVVEVELEPREFDWEFTPGRATRAWGFNGRVPGPTIEARVGDVLQIRLTNHLREPTAVHWHGLRVPAAMDGTEMVQRPVAPGETFTYRFALPDAGTFWYHPHVHETVQLERGLYGAIVVRGDDEPRLDAERVLVLDDVKLDRSGQVAPPGGWKEWHDGRIGETRLVNGREEPELTMAAGQVERWRVVNASSARYVRLSIGGRPFRILGTDGGLIPAPVSATEVVLAPADRVELAVGPFEVGETIPIQSVGSRRKLSLRRARGEPWATLRVGSRAPSEARIPAVLRRIEPLVRGPVEATRVVRLGWKPSLAHGVDFTIDGESHHRAEPVRVGALQVWDIVNGSPMHHPFHLHGFFFQVLEVNGRPPPFLSWEDTVDVPPLGRVRIAWIPDDRPGSWMFHCHILEHHAAGMMAHLDVLPA